MLVTYLGFCWCNYSGFMSYISTDRGKNVHFYTVRCRTAAKMWGCCVLQAILSIPPPTLTWLRTEVRVEFYTAAVWQDHHLNFVCWCQDIMRFWIIQEKIISLESVDELSVCSVKKWRLSYTQRNDPIRSTQGGIKRSLCIRISASLQEMKTDLELLCGFL